MKCQILLSGKMKKKILKCHLLKTLPRVLSFKGLHLKIISVNILYIININPCHAE